MRRPRGRLRQRGHAVGPGPGLESRGVGSGGDEAALCLPHSQKSGALAAPPRAYRLFSGT